uniref:HTH arsR-type domain-containing protein n=1 Tax=uncultured marine thaumarchaeote AD1000_05_B01 TaxID=1455883 RepID=A0A075FHZ1_9ARCH|nr:hypothetical protein [uncultured marine thaumarchaeote AD1000_05_B01]
MRKEGFRNIIQILAHSKLSLTEVADKAKLAKGTVSYHLKNLEELEFVKREKDIYRLDISTTFRNQVLQELLVGKQTGVSLSTIFKNLKEKADHAEKDSVLKKFFAGKQLPHDVKNRLVTVLDVFRSQEHVVMDSKSGNYMITWKGCMELNLCYVCKKKINFSDKNFVMQSVIDNYSNFAPLIHVKCMRELADIGLTIPPEVICHHCGLPLSKKLLQSWYNQESRGFDIVYDLLTPKEMEMIKTTKEIIHCEELKEQFWGIGFQGVQISGKLTDPYVTVEMNRDLVKEIINAFVAERAEKNIDPEWPYINTLYGFEYDLRKELEEGIPTNFSFHFKTEFYLDREKFNEPNYTAVSTILDLHIDRALTKRILQKIELSDIPGVGQVTMERLSQHGITNTVEFYRAGADNITQWLSMDKTDAKNMIHFLETKLKESHTKLDEKMHIAPERPLELLQNWKEKHESKISKFNSALSHLFLTPAYEIHSELKSDLPYPNVDSDTPKPFGMYSEGYSFIHTDKYGNRYHPACYRIQFGGLPEEKPGVIWDGTPIIKKKK